jgi:hypothetical protein
MALQTRWRNQGNVTFAASQKVSFPLSRGMIYKQLFLRLTGAITCTNANNTAAKTKRGDEWAVIQRIDIIVNGTDVIRTFSGNELWWWNYLWYGAQPTISVQLGDSTTANPAFDSTLIIPFWTPQSVKPIDTLLDSTIVSSLTMDVTFGTYTDVNADATAFTTTPVLNVSSEECFGVSGPFSLARIFKINQQPAGANTQYQVQLPVTAMYRSLLINTTNSAGTTDASAITNVKLLSGTNVFHDLPAPVLHSGYRLQRNIQRDSPSYGAAAGLYPPVRRGSTFNSNDYWYILDLVSDGLLSEAIDTVGFSEFILEFNVSGASQVNILPYQIIPIRAAA